MLNGGCRALQGACAGPNETEGKHPQNLPISVLKTGSTLMNHFLKYRAGADAQEMSRLKTNGACFSA